MNVSLTPELERLVHDKVLGGRYLSASEVVREALRLLEERDQMREFKLDELRRLVAVGIEAIDRGEVSPLDLDATLAEIRAHKPGASE